MSHSHTTAYLHARGANAVTMKHFGELARLFHQSVGGCLVHACIAARECGLGLHWFIMQRHRVVAATGRGCCPCCGHNKRYRLRRAIWMRLHPSSRLYLCDGCAMTYLVTHRSTYLVTSWD
jgi:hypothetical protein